MTEDELLLLNSCSNWLHGQCENSLTRIKRLFPGNRPPEGVGKLEHITTIQGSYWALKTWKVLIPEV
jgi:hypothetical protein